MGCVCCVGTRCVDVGYFGFESQLHMVGKPPSSFLISGVFDLGQLSLSGFAFNGPGGSVRLLLEQYHLGRECYDLSPAVPPAVVAHRGPNGRASDNACCPSGPCGTTVYVLKQDVDDPASSG
jgi:hypothetical protein